MELFDHLNQLFRTSSSTDSQSLNRLKSNLQQCTGKLESILDVSTKLVKASEEQFDGIVDPEWQVVVDTLSLKDEEAGGDNVSQSRWKCLLCGWLPQLQVLCLIMEQLSAADRIVNQNDESAPLDMLSLRTICMVHCGLEFVIQWGIGSRLDSATYGSLCRRNMKPLSKAAMQLLKITDGRVSVPSLFGPIYPQSQNSADSKDPSEIVSEHVSLRELRVCACAMLVEKCLNIPQIRSLLLPRYYPHLIISYLGLSESSQMSVKQWAQQNLLAAFSSTSVRAEIEGLDEKTNGLITPGGLSVAVRSLRELSATSKGRLSEEVGGMLSAVVCLDGGLEAVLDSFVGPVNAAQAAEDGSVEAVEALARHLGSPPLKIDPRIYVGGEMLKEENHASRYMRSICPQLGSLLHRSLFVYGLGNVLMDNEVHSHATNSTPPPEALSGLMSHMVLRLVGRVAESAKDAVKEHQFRQHVIFPLLRPLLLAQVCLVEGVKELHVPSFLIHTSVVCLHALIKLVSPTPALVTMLNPIDMKLTDNSKFSSDPCYRSFCEVGILPCMIRLYCFLSKQKVVDLEDINSKQQAITSRRVHESIVALLHAMPPSEAVEAILHTLHLVGSRSCFYFSSLEGNEAVAAQEEAQRHYCVSDGIVLKRQKSDNAEEESVVSHLESVGTQLLKLEDGCIDQESMEVCVELCHKLVLEVDSISSSTSPKEDFLMVYLFELLLTRFLDHGQSNGSIQQQKFTQIEMLMFVAISSNSDPLQLLSSSTAGLAVLRVLIKMVPSLIKAFSVSEESPLISSRTFLASLLVGMLSTLILFGPPPTTSEFGSQREVLLKSLVVPLGNLSLVLTSNARSIEPSTSTETDLEDQETSEDIDTSILDISEKCQEVHLQLIRRWSQSSIEAPPSSVADIPSLDWDSTLMAVVEAASRDLIVSSPPVRARAVFDITSVLKRLCAAAESSQPNTNSLIEEVGGLSPYSLRDETLGSLLGVLLGMLADRESYVYLGAVHAIRCLTDIPPQSTRSRHIKILVFMFAQTTPCFDDALKAVISSAQTSMEPLMRFHLNQSSQKEIVEDLSLVLKHFNTGSEGNVYGTVPLTYSQRTALGEALVLTVRWCGSSAPYHASVLFPVLIRGASPLIGLNQSSEMTLHQRRSIAAFRTSCFSAIAEVGEFLGWAIQRYATDLVDLCCGCLRLERSASEDLFQRAGLTTEESLNDGHMLAARRAAAFLGRKLIESCGYHMLQSGDSRGLQKLHQLFVDINEGPGVARASTQLNQSGSTGRSITEWSLELDPVVRSHVACGLESMNDLLLQGTSGLATYVLPK